MKSILTSLFVVFALNIGFAQITITNSDMPAVGDTFRVSNGLIAPAIDPVPTGAQFTWDFSNLQMVTQDIDTFLSVASTGTIYSLVFSNLPFNPYRANLAAKGPSLPAIPQVTISDVVYFYYNSSSAYEVSGYGANINGISVPITFNSKDRVYNFPANFGNTDSSDSDFQLAIPGLGYYGHDQHRVNEVDGWGTLITPFGSFNTLRVKSMISSNDSLYLDSVGTGFAFSLPPTTEYKWLGAQSGIPLLQITTTNTLGTEIVTAIRYRDSVRTTTGIPEINAVAEGVFELFPNPSNGQLTLHTNSAKQQSGTIQLYSTEGKLVQTLWKGTFNAGENLVQLDVRSSSVANGIYLLNIVTENGNQNKSLMINK